MLYVFKQNPLAQRKSIKTEDLRLLPLAMLSKYLQRERELTSRLDSIGCPPNIVMRLSQISALQSIVERDLACAVQIWGRSGAAFLPQMWWGSPLNRRCRYRWR